MVLTRWATMSLAGRTTCSRSAAEGGVGLHVQGGKAVVKEEHPASFTSARAMDSRCR